MNANPTRCMHCGKTLTRKRRVLRLWVKVTITLGLGLGLVTALVQYQNTPNSYELRMNARR